MRNMNKNISILCAATASLASCQGQVRQVRPNIVCIVAEDISPYLGCYGDAVAKTPNLDRPAQTAIRYTDMHTTVGVSSPSRFALITGMYPSAMGGNFMRNQSAPEYLPEGIEPYEVVLPEGIRAYTEYMREAGYYCTNNSKTDYQFSANVAHWDENSNEATWKNCPEGMPFLSIFNINTSHESRIWMGKDSLEILPEDIDMSRFPYLPDDSVIRRDLARMYTNIAIMDRETQTLLDELEASERAEHTIVIWYSDNGGPIPRGKRSIYNTGSNVPFMVRFPDGYRQGEVDNRLCLFMDIPATILSLAGIRPPEYMHGRAFLGPSTQPERDYIYGARDRFDEVIDKCGFIQDHHYQYIRNYMPEIAGYLNNSFRLSMPMMKRMIEMYEAGELSRQQSLWFKAPRPEEEFYDLRNDPYELNNLAGNPAYQKDMERLRDHYERWNGSVNVNWRRSEKEWREIHWPGGIQPAVDTPEVSETGNTLTLVCRTPGATICYKVNDTIPPTTDQIRPGRIGYSSIGENWLIYTRPIKNLKKGDRIKIVAVRSGYKTSEITTLTLQ